MNYDMHPGAMPFINHLNAAYGPHASAIFLAVITAVIVWSFIWKGFALWYAARNHQKGWFIVMLIINTLGILEILYLAFGRKNKNTAVTTTTTTHTTIASTPAPATPAPEAALKPEMPSLAPTDDHV